MNITVCTPPVGADQRDVRVTVANNVPQTPDALLFQTDGTLQVVYLTFVPTSQQISSVQAAVAATTPDPNQPWNVAATLNSKAQAGLTTNATFLALPSPSQAQTLAQVQTLTKECNTIIRLLLGQLDSTSGT